MRSFLTHLLLSFALALTLLFLVYPWSQYQSEDSSFGWRETLASYVIVAGLMATLADLLHPLWQRIRHGRPDAGLRAGAAIAAVSLGVVLLLIFMFSGPGLFLNVPGTRVRGIFFAEWQFVVFLLQVGIPFSAINAGIQVWLGRKATTGSTP